MEAFGKPGMAPTWTSSAKDLVGCSLGPSRLWFTTGHGILNEVYTPRVDIPQIRDLGFIVADDRGFWVEVKRLDSYRTHLPAPGVPALEIIHTHPRFKLHLRLVPDPHREVLLIELALSGDPELRPYALLAPHLGGTGHGNVAGAGIHNGRRLLWAEQGPFGLACAAADAGQRDAWGLTSAGYVGASDGWQDFNRHGRLDWRFETAGPGNVALIGALPRRATLALGFGTSREAAATLALSSLSQSFDACWAEHVRAWQSWHETVQVPADLPDELREQLSTSAMVLRVHQDKTYPGAMVASLSIPWGNTNDSVGGYHLVWPRDVVESAGGLLALGALHEARDILRYLISTQLADGSWSQNQWLGGKPYWRGSQLDEAAFPVLLAAALAERDGLDGIEVAAMIHGALGFIARTGPASEQDRWEEDAGINAFTLATCIAALVCGAAWLEAPVRAWALRIADDWNSHVEEWTAVRETNLAAVQGVRGYYVRVAPPAGPDGIGHLDRTLAIKNRIRDPNLKAEEQISTDFLQLVRLGLRDPADPLIVDTLKLVDALLKVETPVGPAWHRYNGDGYGEHEDGAAFDGSGTGRAWPLLTGERGHCELAAGEDALPYLSAMARMVGRCGLIPEQVWDGVPPPGMGLLPGKPSGSAMPLVWAHAEFVKLVASRALGRPFDRPEAVWARYAGCRPAPADLLWSLNAPIASLRAEQLLWVCLPGPARIHHGTNGWQNVADTDTQDSGLGLHVARIPTTGLIPGDVIDFTFFWTGSRSWSNANHRIQVV